MGCNCGSGAPAGTVYKITTVVDGERVVLGYRDTRSEAAVIRASQDDPAVRTAVRITQAQRSEMDAWLASQSDAA